MPIDVNRHAATPAAASTPRPSAVERDLGSLDADREAVFLLASACQAIAGHLGSPDPFLLHEQLVALRSALPRRLVVAQLVAEHLLVALALKFRSCLPAWRPERDEQLLSILWNPAADASGALLEFLIDLLDESRSCTMPRAQGSPEVQAKLHLVLEEIRTRHADRTFTLKTAAARVGLTQWHLDRLLTRHTGHSFVYHAREARLAAAQALLDTTFKSIKEVAAATGYNSVTHLDRDFRKRHGCSPRAWRDRQAQERLTDSKK